MKIANKMNVPAAAVVLANLNLGCFAGTLAAQIVDLGTSWLTCEDGKEVTMVELKRRIDNSFTEKGEEPPAKGVEYRKIVFTAYLSQGVFAKEITLDKLLNKAETEQEKRVGKFLKKVSDYIRNNYEVKTPRAPKNPVVNEPETTEEPMPEKTDQEKRVEALATLELLFAGNAKAAKHIEALRKLA